METMEKSFSSMRDLVATVAGPRDWNDTRQSWLARAASRAGISYRQAHALFYGEITNPQSRSATKMRHAAEQLGSAAARLEIIDADFHQPDIAAFRALAERVGNLERGAQAQAGSREGDAEGLEE